MTAKQTIRDFLAMLAAATTIRAGYHYQNKDAFLLRHGQFFAPHPLPKGIRRGLRRRCFSNAYRLATKRGWRYVEGYAVRHDGSPLPILHGWVLDDEDCLVDPTWVPSGVAYFGVVFPLSVVTAARMKVKGRTSFDDGGVLDDWVHQWPILREPFQPT